MGMEAFNDTPLVNGTAYPTVTRGPEGLSLPHPERGQRPLLQPAALRGRRHAATEVRAESPPRSAGGGCAGRPDGLPDAGHGHQPAGPGLDPDRHRGRLPAGAGGHPAAADHLGDRPDRVQRRQRRPALAAARPGRARGRDRRLLRVRGQDADPLQRRPGGLPGARPALRLLHGQRGPAGTRAARRPTLPGYGPNTRTVMQIKVADVTPAPAFDAGRARGGVRAPGATGRACSSPRSTRSSSGRARTTRPTARRSRATARRAGLAQIYDDVPGPSTRSPASR